MSDYCFEREIFQHNHDVSKGQTNTRNMPHIWVGDIGRSGPWSSARVVVLQSTIVRRTHFCAMISVQSGVLSLIIGNLFFLCPRVVNQTSTGRIIDTYLLLVWGEDGRKRTVGKGHSLFHVCALVLQHSSVNLSDRLFVLEKQ